MKYSTRLSDAVHILAFIALYPDCDLTSNKLAESIQTNPAYVRQLMSALRKGGLLVSVKGHPRPALAREPEKDHSAGCLSGSRGQQAPAPSGHPHQSCLRRGCKYPTGAAGFLLGHSKNSGTKNARNHAERCAGTISHESWKGRPCSVYDGSIFRNSSIWDKNSSEREIQNLFAGLY